MQNISGRYDTWSLVAIKIYVYNNPIDIIYCILFTYYVMRVK